MDVKTIVDFKRICSTVSSDLKLRRITQKQVAEIIGTTKQTVANQLSGKKRFSSNMAKKFAEAFGYDERFLLYGVGNLYDEEKGVILLGGEDKSTDESNQYYIRYRDKQLIYDNQILAAKMLFEILNNKIAISAFQAYLDGEYNEFDELTDILKEEYAYKLVIPGVPPMYEEYLKRTRQWFTDVETKAAKELVLIESKAACGELIDVDAEVERFRKRVLWIKVAHKDAAMERHPNLEVDNYITKEEQQEYQKMMPKEKEQR